jgi:phospholipid transport system substrate-binding protein
LNRLHLMAGALLALSLFVSQAFASHGPEELVRQTSEQVLEEVKSRKQELDKEPEKIYGLVEHIVLPRFDFTRMSRLVLGKYWNRATDAEKDSFIREFRELLVRTYATALLNYSGQAIVYLPSHHLPDATEVTVDTQVAAEGAVPIPINYSLYRDGEEWKVFDVKIDGISLVSNYRSGFASQIRRYKLSGLIARLEQKNNRD